MRREINWLFKLTKNTLRIICVFTFLHWIFFTTYANCTSYYESINKAKNHKEEVEYGKDKKQSIAKIEEKILEEIEEKIKTSGLKREWADKWLPELEGMPKSSEEEKKNYDKKLKESKEETIKNIQKQLRENDLDITELDDQRTLWGKIWYDPLKFFFVSPLNRVNKFLSKSLNLQEPFVLEIVFKLLIVKLFFVFFISYSEEKGGGFLKELEKMQDPSLSMEEKEKIQQEASPLIWRGIFNFLLTVPLTLFLVFHPCFVDRSTSQYLAASSWLKWVVPMILVSFASSISNEFLRQGRILRVKEIKEYLAKNWLIVIIISLLSNIALPYWLSIINTYGYQLIFFCSGLIDFMINIIKAGIVQESKKEPKD